MKKKIIGSFVVMLFVAAAVLPVAVGMDFGDTWSNDDWLSFNLQNMTLISDICGNKTYSGNITNQPKNAEIKYKFIQELFFATMLRHCSSQEATNNKKLGFATARSYEQ